MSGLWRPSGTAEKVMLDDREKDIRAWMKAGMSKRNSVFAADALRVDGAAKDFVALRDIRLCCSR